MRSLLVCPSPAGLSAGFSILTDKTGVTMRTLTYRAISLWTCDLAFLVNSPRVTSLFCPRCRQA